MQRGAVVTNYCCKAIDKYVDKNNIVNNILAKFKLGYIINLKSHYDEKIHEISTSFSKFLLSL